MMRAATQYGADGMNDVLCRYRERRRNSDLSRGAADTRANLLYLPAGPAYFGASRAMDSTIDTPATQHPFVGGVDDRVDVKRRDVGFHYTDSVHRS